MTWRKIAAAAALVASISPALATDQSVTLGPILGGTSAAFTGKSTLLAGGDDIISFLGLPGDPYNFSFNLLSGVAVSSVKVNGLDALLTTTTALTKTFLLIGAGSGPLTAQIFGTQATVTNPFLLLGSPSYYAGTMQVTAVPEPESYAMLLAGLVGIGGIVRRRRA